MKIVETIMPVNAEKVIIGDREIKLTMDTDTGRLAIETPTMFSNPVVSLDDLLEKLNTLQDQFERSRGT
jgi:tetrahydromethanopterin S-methyltransferase subunit B